MSQPSSPSPFGGYSVPQSPSAPPVPTAAPAYAGPQQGYVPGQYAPQPAAEGLPRVTDSVATASLIVAIIALLAYGVVRGFQVADAGLVFGEVEDLTAINLAVMIAAWTTTVAAAAAFGIGLAGLSRTKPALNRGGRGRAGVSVGIGATLLLMAILAITATAMYMANQLSPSSVLEYFGWWM